MQFNKTADLVLSLKKKETRRPALMTDRLWIPLLNGLTPMTLERYIEDGYVPFQIAQVDRLDSTGKYRKLFSVGQDYSICPGRGKRQLGRFKLEWIYAELLQDIDGRDAAREIGWGEECLDCDALSSLHWENELHWWVNGQDRYEYEAIDEFVKLWTSIYDPKISPYAWDRNPWVYPLGINLLRNSTKEAIMKATKGMLIERTGL